MASFFKRSKKTIDDPSTASVIDKMQELAEIHEQIDARIEAAMKQLMDPNMIAAMQAGEDTGGYFGNEFELRLNAGRMKSIYQREDWVNAASTLIARKLASLPFNVHDKVTGVKLPKHPLGMLFKAGSIIEGGMAAQWAGNLDLDLTGNCFFVLDEALRGYMHVPTELCTIKLADPVKDGRIGLQTLTVSVPETAVGTKKIYDYRYVIHIKMPNPTSKFYGMPVWVAASRAILLNRYKNEYEMAFYLRGATHSGVIETQEDITTKRLARLMRTFESAFTGRRNWWRPLFLPKGAKWVSGSPTMAEMQHLEGMRENRKTILAVRGVPPSMVGLVEDVNRATAEQQERALYENTIIPMAYFNAAGWNNSYLVKTVFRDMVELRPDFSEVECLQGSLVSKGEQAKAVEGTWKIDEIRSKIYGMGPIGDDRGNKLVAEIRAPVLPAAGGSGGQSLMDQVAGGTPPSQLPPSTEPATALPAADQTAPPEGKSVGITAKAEATSSQNRIEEKLWAAVDRAYKAYIGATLHDAAQVIARHGDLRKTLAHTRPARLAAYWDDAQKTMIKALDRGFAMSQANIRMVPGMIEQRRLTYVFTQEDYQALDILRERTADGQRKILADRLLKRFWGHDENVTEQIMQIIDNSHAAGESWSEIARDIRDKYGDQYPNQANTIVRTEILTAVSQGWKWNNDALNQIFTKVQKQWLHQGDRDNPDARHWHIDYDDKTGIVDTDYVYEWTDPKSGKNLQIRYPRDPSGDAQDIINCRCSVVSVIPHDAQSNAQTIIDQEF